MKILLATDGSIGSFDAAWLLSHLPHRETLELTILSVVYVPEIHGTLDTQNWMEHQSEIEKQRAKETFRRISKMFTGADAKLELRVIEGHVASTIVDQAEELDADLVVLGARGHTTIDRLLLGSVSDFVATHAKCSVLVMRPTGLRENIDRKLRMCIAYDDSEPSKNALEEIGEFGWGKETHIDIVSAVSFMGIYTAEIPVVIDASEIRNAMLASTKRVAKSIADYSPDIEAHVIEADHVAQGIIDFAEERGSDLILVGSTGRGMVGRMFLGSVSRYVLRHAECSVWISRDPKRID